MKALLIVDVQYDFLPGGSLEVPNGNEVIPVINELQHDFDLVVATQDWHPPHHMSFASNNEGREPFETIEVDGMEQIMWPDHCIQGSRGAEISEEVDMKHVEAIFRKGTDPRIDSYSGFFDNGHQKSTGLADYLRGRGVEEVYVTGLAGDVCVYFTVLDSLRENFRTYLINDGTRALDQDKFDKQKSEIVQKGGKVIDTREAIQA